MGFAPQVQALRRGVDIVVATPGRLLDHVEQRTIDLRQVEILVLDEADRMLDMGFIHDIRRVLKLLPAKRQNLLFSATFPEEVRTLAAGFMRCLRCLGWWGGKWRNLFRPLSKTTRAASAARFALGTDLWADIRK